MKTLRLKDVKVGTRAFVDGMWWWRLADTGRALDPNLEAVESGERAVYGNPTLVEIADKQTRL